jgi:MarR family 2-MHQ and catechol resistance regulon transcriptional repressor
MSEQAEASGVEASGVEASGGEASGVEASGVKVWAVLWKAARAVEAHAVVHIKSLGFGVAEFAVLEALMHKGAMPVNIIGRKILLTSGSMTAVVDKLEKKGLVQREDHVQDRRIRVVKLTKEGRKVIESAFVAHQAVMDRAASALSPDERLELIRLLKILGLRAREDLETE